MQNHARFLLLFAIAALGAAASIAWNRSLDFWAGPAATIVEPILPLHPEISEILDDAQSDLRHGEVASSEARCEEARAHAQATGDRSLEADTLHCLGRAHFKRGHYSIARSYYEEALAIAKQLDDGSKEAFFRYDLGTCFSRLAESELALDNFKESLEGRTNSRDRSITLMEMATLLDQDGEHQLAIENLREAFVMGKDSLFLTNEDRLTDQAAILDRLGAAYSKAGLFPAAEEAFGSAMEIYSGEVGQEQEQDPEKEWEQRLNLAVSTNNLGLVYIRQCKKDRADDPAAVCPRLQETVVRLESALELLGDSSKHNRSLFLFRLAQVFRLQGDLEVATKTLLESIEIIETVRAETTNSLLRTSFLARHSIIYHELILTLMARHRLEPERGISRLALLVADRLRARDLLDRKQRTREIRQKLAAGNQDMIQELNQLENKKLLFDYHRQESPETLAKIEEKQRELILQLEELEKKQPSPDRPEHGTTKLSLRPTDLKLPRLDPHTTLLFFSLTDEKSFLWRIEATSTSTYELPANGAEIEKKARALAHWLSEGEKISDPRPELIQWLSEVLLGEVADSLRNQKLLLVLDGSLEAIPFGLLQNPRTGRPLLEKHDTIRLPSLEISAALQEIRDSQPKGASHRGDLVIVADPVYAPKNGNYSSSTGMATLPPPNPLVYSGEEAEAILALYPPEASQLYRGFDATREAILGGALQGFRTVHIIAHAEANEVRPELTQLILSLVDADDNPIEGRLFVHEIDDLELDCDLIVLSACSTAVGKKVRGEGMLDMTRAFLAAGARQAIVSLWNVDDEATAELMKHFYRALREEEKTPSAALRSAQRAIQRDDRWTDPYFWSSFVIVGD